MDYQSQLSMRTAYAQGIHHRAGIAPSEIQPLVNSFGTHRDIPRTDAFSDAVYRHKAIGGLITPLFLRRGPSHVPDFVMAVIVFAVECMFRSRLAAYVIYKLLIGCKPKLNAATAVTRVFGVFGISTSSLCAHISCIFHGSPAVSFTMRSIVQWSDFIQKTSTRLCMLGQQIAASNFDDLPAVAFTKPLSAPVLSASQTNNGQASKAAPFQINKLGLIRGLSGENNVIFGVRHFANSPKDWISNLSIPGEVLVASLRAFFILPNLKRIRIQTMQEVFA